MAQRVFLVPGFLGFAAIGSFKYFSADARAALERRLSGPGSFVVTPIGTDPTGSLADRQRSLIEQLAPTAQSGDDLHLVGHSTGGLDAQLLLGKAPLGGGTWDERGRLVRGRLRSVTALSAPFWGSYIAEEVSKLVDVFQLRDQLFGLRRAGAPLLDRAREPNDLIDLLVEALREPRQTLAFLFQVARDHELLRDLRPRYMRSIQASFQRTAEVKASFAYLVGVGPGPSLASGLPYQVACLLTSRVGGASPPAGIDAAHLGHDWIRGARAPDDPAVDLAASDGIVNSLLQVLDWQRPRAVALADHADVLGHYRRPETQAGELDSASGFDEAALEELYGRIAENIREGLK